MFQQLRQNSQVYIFHKGNTPLLEIGYVSNYPVVKPKYNVPPTFGNQQEMIVDLIVKIGDQLVNYNQLPANLDIADSFSNGESIVISDNREAMNAEILNFKQKSIDTLNSIDVHKDIIFSCDKILNDLNPEYAEKKQQQSEMNTLKSQINEMNKSITALTGLVEQLTRKENINEQNVGNQRQ